MALTRKKITVRGKSGKTFQRSVMVRAGEAVKRTAGKVAKFVGKHKGKIAGAALGAAAVAGGLALAHRKGKIDLRGMAGNARHAVGTLAGAARGAASAGAGRAGAALGRAKSYAQGVSHDASKARQAYGAARAAGAPRRDSAGIARGEFSARRKHSSRSGK